MIPPKHHCSPWMRPHILPSSWLHCWPWPIECWAEGANQARSVSPSGLGWCQVKSSSQVCYRQWLCSSCTGTWCHSCLLLPHVQDSDFQIMPVLQVLSICHRFESTLFPVMEMRDYIYRDSRPGSRMCARKLCKPFQISYTTTFIY